MLPHDANSSADVYGYIAFDFDHELNNVSLRVHGIHPQHVSVILSAIRKNTDKDFKDFATVWGDINDPTQFEALVNRIISTINTSGEGVVVDRMGQHVSMILVRVLNNGAN